MCISVMTLKKKLTQKKENKRRNKAKKYIVHPDLSGSKDKIATLGFSIF